VSDGKRQPASEAAASGGKSDLSLSRTLMINMRQDIPASALCPKKGSLCLCL